MSKTKKPDGEEKPKGGKMKLIIGALALLGCGAGGAYGAVAAGIIGAHEEASGPDEPKLIAKGAEDPFAPAASKDKKDAVEPVHGEGGSKYQTSYYSFEESFTSNLFDSPSLIQVSLAASTHRDGRVLQWLKLHELAVRSAILAELAATPEEDAYSLEGKKRLQARLAKAINQVLTDQEGFGGIDSVHFQTFLVQ